MKNSLFQNSKDNKVDKSKREALDKVNAMLKENIISHDYLKDLVKVIEMDGLSGHSLRFINKLTKKDFASLPDEIEQSYINKMINTAGEIETGSEVLILSEEIL